MFILLVPAAPVIDSGKTVSGEVVGIADGDTLTILVEQTQYRVRLFGSDAPEKGQAFGTRSRQALSEKVFGKTVEVVSHGPDRYGRTIGETRLDGRDINLEMVREGWAWHYKRYSKSKALAGAEKQARKAKAGLWADPNLPAPGKAPGGLQLPLT